MRETDYRRIKGRVRQGWNQCVESVVIGRVSRINCSLGAIFPSVLIVVVERLQRPSLPVEEEHASLLIIMYVGVHSDVSPSINFVDELFLFLVRLRNVLLPDGFLVYCQKRIITRGASN